MYYHNVLGSKYFACTEIGCCICDSWLRLFCEDVSFPLGNLKGLRWLWFNCSKLSSLQNRFKISTICRIDQGNRQIESLSKKVDWVYWKAHKFAGLVSLQKSVNLSPRINWKTHQIEFSWYESGNWRKLSLWTPHNAMYPRNLTMENLSQGKSGFKNLPLLFQVCTPLYWQEHLQKCDQKWTNSSCFMSVNYPER